MAGASSKQDEVFGLPFLFTGGLPNSLEKFSEGNLRCFLTYLIEVVGKANRQNVWQKPLWWKSKLIPYSPVSIDTSNLHPDQVLPELKGLVESCYKYYKAEKILEVSKQLAEIPRILLGIKDNKDNTWTVYDKVSKAVYVTVRPENLHYDVKSLDKVSNDWRSSVDKEDVTFTKIKKSSKTQNEVTIIELSDSEDEDKKIVKKESPRRKCKSLSPSSPENKDANKSRNSLQNTDPEGYKKKQKDLGPPWNQSAACLDPLQPVQKPQMRSCGIVVRSGNDLVIALSDSDDDCESKQSFDKSNFTKHPLEKHRGYSVYDQLPGHNSQGNEIKSEQTKTRKKPEEDIDVEFICEVIPSSKPCPKRFKKTNQAVNVSPNVIILSDSDEEEISTPYICSYTSLAKNYTGGPMQYPETPNKNVQKSILGPLLCSPRKGLLQPQRVPRVALSPLKWPTKNNSTKSPSPVKKVVTPPQLSPSSLAGNKKIQVIRESSSSENEERFKPTREELFLKKRKPRKIFYPETSLKEDIVEPVDFTVKNQAEFMSFLGMNNKSSVPLKSPIKKPPLSERKDFVAIVRSKYASYSRMPLEWIQALSGANNSVILTKKSSRYKQYDPTKINYEAFCSTNKSFVEYNIKANSKVGKEGKSDKQVGRRGCKEKSFFLKKLVKKIAVNMKCGRSTRSMEKKDRTIEKWFIQSEETAHRNKRASIRMLRSLCSGDLSIKPKQTVNMGTLVPTVERLPNNIFERALQMTVRMNDIID